MQTKILSLQHEINLLQTENKQNQSLIADYKVTAAKHENLIDSLRKEAQTAQNELRQVHLEFKDGLAGENNAQVAREQAEQTIQAANEEIVKIQAHYENESAQIKRERVDLIHRVQDLTQQNERIKIDCMRQLNHFKAKYTEYKQKLRKANQNIATLLGRIAKYDIQTQADKHDEEGGNLGSYGMQMADEPNWQHLLAQAGIDGVQQMNVHELLANDGLNDEIKKLF